MTLLWLLSSLLLALAGPIEKPPLNPGPCTIAVEEIIPYFRSNDANGPQFQVWVRNVGTTTIEYAQLWNAARLDLDGETLPPIGTFASVEPSGFAPGERGFDNVILKDHLSLQHLKSGLHVLTYVCGRVRSTPLHFLWQMQGADPARPEACGSKADSPNDCNGDRQASES